MKQNQNKIASSVMTRIRNHITTNERAIKHPYLDRKGNLTIGKGFKIDTEDQFADLNVDIKRNGRLVPASESDKRNAYRKMMAKKRSLGGAFNNVAESYKNETDIKMSDPAMDARLNGEIHTRMAKIRNNIGDAAWHKLNLAQQTAIIDIHYNNGSLKDFPSLKKAIIAGDAKAMAEESLYFSDRSARTRDHERLVRNFKALGGISQSDAERELAKILHGKGEPMPTFLQKALPVPAPIQTPAISPPTEENSLASLRAKGLSNDTSFAGTAGDDFQISQGGQASQLANDLTRPDGPLDEILAKSPQHLTQDEAKAIMRARMALPSGPEQRALATYERAVYDHAFGTAPAPVDSTGRVINAPPRRPFPRQPVPAQTPDGSPLADGIRQVATALTNAAARNGRDTAVKALQTSINMLNTASDSPAPPLKIDGLAGPRTRRALHIVTARSGPERIIGNMEIGGFGAIT